MLAKASRRIKWATRVLIKGTPPAHKRREIPAITLEEVAEAKAFFPMDKFFIYGHARSGTTLLARLVRLHPEVHCNYQAHFFTRTPLLEALVSDVEVGAWLSRRSNRWNRGRDLSPVVIRAASDFVMEREARKEGKRIVGDKSPNSLLDGESVRLMCKIYPDARLVFVVRDGRDTAVSHRFQAFIDNPQSLSKDDLEIRQAFTQTPETFLSGQRSIFTEKKLRQSAQGWVQNVVETDQLGRELLGEQYFHMRYEDLLQHPQQEMHRLWSFLGTNPTVSGLDQAVTAELRENPDADWQQKKAGYIAKALQKGKRGSWREFFTSRDRRIFKEIAGETLIAWKYEANLDW